MSSSFRVLLLLSLVCSCCLFSFVACIRFEVGGDGGWRKPKSSGDGFYNDWASKYRFQVNDTLRFKYDKDSVMEVGEDEYKKCQTTKPKFFSNSGDTVFKLERPGPYYFISGVAGHCEKGMKMIVKVLDTQTKTETNVQPTKSFASPKTVGLGAVSMVMMVALVLV